MFVILPVSNIAPMSAHKIVNRNNSLHVFEPSVNLESILRSYNKNNYLRSPLFAWTTFYKKVWKHVNFKWKFTCFINNLWTATININSPIPTDTTFWRVYRNHLVRLSIRLYVQLYLVHIFLIEKNWRFLLNTKIAYDHRVWHVFYPSSFLQVQGYWKKKKCNICDRSMFVSWRKFLLHKDLLSAWDVSWFWPSHLGYFKFIGKKENINCFLF